MIDLYAFGSPSQVVDGFSLYYHDFYSEHDILEPLEVLVPDFGAANYVKDCLAQKYDTVSGVRFKSLIPFIITKLNPGLGVVSKELIFHRLVDKLLDAKLLSQEHFKFLRRYLEGIGSKVQGDNSIQAGSQLDSLVKKRLVRFFDKISYILVDYSFSRYQYFEKWKEDKDYFDKLEPGKQRDQDDIVIRELVQGIERGKKVEELEKKLWRLLFANELFLEEGERKLYPLGLLLHEYRRGNLSKDAFAEFPDELALFGFGTLPRIYLEFFGKIYAGQPDKRLVVFDHNLTNREWSSLPVTRQDQEYFLLNQQKLEFKLWENDEVAACPLLKWGAPLQDYYKNLDDLWEGDYQPQTPSFMENLEPKNDLEKLQRSIFFNSPIKSLELDSIDDSLHFMAAPTPKMEIKRILETILDKMDNDDKLEFGDFLIVVHPNSSQNSYVNLLLSAQREYRVEMEILGSTDVFKLNRIELLLGLLRVVRDNYSRQAMVELITNPIMEDYAPHETRLQWLEWIQNLNIYRGLDKTSSRADYTREDFFNWEQGIRRLLLGKIVQSSNTLVDFGAGSAGKSDGSQNKRRYLPCDLAEENEEGLELFLNLVRLLGEFGRKSLKKRTFLNWYEQMKGLLTALFYQDDPFDTGENLREFLTHVNELEEHYRSAFPEDDGKKRDFTTFSAIWETKLGGLDTKDGRKFRGKGICVSPLDRIGSIPWKYVFVTGMGEGNFPTGAAVSSLDLRRFAREQGDISPRATDQLRFIQLLFQVQQGLYLSYINHDSVTGEKLTPNFMFTELLQYLVGTGEDKPLEETVEVIPPESSESLRGRYYSALQYRLAQARHQPYEYFLPEVNLENVFSGEESLKISPRQFANFVYFPLKGFYSWAIGSEEDEKMEILDSEFESFQLETLVKYNIYDRCVLKALEILFATPSENQVEFESLLEEVLKFYDEVVSKNELSGKFPAGVLKDWKSEEEEENLKSLLKNMKEAPLKTLFEQKAKYKLQILHFGEARREEPNPTIRPPIRKTVQVTDPQGKQKSIDLEFRGKFFPFLYNQEDKEVVFLLYLNSKKQNKAEIQGLVGAMLLNLCSEFKIERVRVFGFIYKNKKVEEMLSFHYPLDYQEKLLTNWIEELLYGAKEHLLDYDLINNQQEDKEFLVKLNNNKEDELEFILSREIEKKFNNKWDFTYKYLQTPSLSRFVQCSKSLKIIKKMWPYEISKDEKSVAKRFYIVLEDNRN
ncbi:MAG: exodeoxyribonuclease V subunit gamma [Deltaproteobacteria bacterium]|jgi:exonuclease V gamma subunit|nr:exodeoxyribonuclease V subunit gamma [Deltaproteobacteria bacterium]